MSEIEVTISLEERDQGVSTLFRQSVRGKEAFSFAYRDDWFGNPLGVTDVSRLGALRFKRVDQDEIQKPTDEGVPGFIHLGRLLGSAERIERNSETDEDLDLIYAPESLLGGARPKASVMDSQGNLASAKFPKDADDYPIETWVHIALCDPATCDGNSPIEFHPWQGS